MEKHHVHIAQNQYRMATQNFKFNFLITTPSGDTMLSPEITAHGGLGLSKKSSINQSGATHPEVTIYLLPMYISFFFSSFSMSICKEHVILISPGGIDKVLLLLLLALILQSTHSLSPCYSRSPELQFV